MTSQYASAVVRADAHVRSLIIVVALQFVVIMALWWGWSRAPKDLTVHVPPDLRDGVILTIEEIPPQNVYVFAEYIFKQLNRWNENGLDDYGENIFSLNYFFTPRYYEWLQADYKTKRARGELQDRTRAGLEIPGHTYEEARVDILSDGAWVVWIDYEIKEWIGSLETKSVQIRYPLRVVRLDADRERNPWGLAIDGYPDGLTPARLSDIEKIATVRNSGGGQ